MAPFLPNGDLSLYADPLAAVMLGVVGGVSTAVYVYSLAYMDRDPGQQRFFIYLDYFVASMALLMLAGNPVVLLVDWSGVGLASLRQSSLKRGIAYSTASQLGYMFAGIGLGAPFAAFFHLVTNASFKALLLLSAGVVIHTTGGEEQLARLGGLRKALPAAFRLPGRGAGPGGAAWYGGSLQQGSADRGWTGA